MWSEINRSGGIRVRVPQVMCVLREKISLIGLRYTFPFLLNLHFLLQIEFAFLYSTWRIIAELASSAQKIRILITNMVNEMADMSKSASRRGQRIVREITASTPMSATIPIGSNWPLITMHNRLRQFDFLCLDLIIKCATLNICVINYTRAGFWFYTYLNVTFQQQKFHSITNKMFPHFHSNLVIWLIFWLIYITNIHITVKL